MKTFRITLLLSALMGATLVPAQGQSSRTNDAYTLELLRRTLEEQQKNPKKVIPTFTELPPVTIKMAPAGSTNSPVSPEMAELERQYLSGKLSSKQYQKAVEQLQKKTAAKVVSAPPAKPTATAKPVSNPAISPKDAAASGVKVVAPEPAIATPTPPPNPNLQKLSDVDQKIEEMMKREQDRKKAAAAAAAALPTSNPDGTPLSKRQRLDLLLRQVVEGKLTDEQYKVAREKIVAEPD